MFVEYGLDWWDVFGVLCWLECGGERHVEFDDDCGDRCGCGDLQCVDW